MKRGAWFRFGKQAANESADDRTTDAEQSRHDETEMLYPGITARAINPTMKPTIMYQMMCNIDLPWLSLRG